MRYPFYIFIISLIGLCLQSCHIYEDTGYKKRYVIESYLVANRTLPAVRLSHTVPADQAYSFSENAVTQADVSIALLNKNNGIEQRISYTEDSAGVYTPTESVIVKPRHTYRLQARINSKKILKATTTVPNSYSLKGNVPDSVEYQAEKQIEVTLVPDAPDTLQRQKQFVFNLISPQYKIAPPTPFYADQLEDEETTRKEYRNNSSGLVSEGNFTVNPNGSIDIKVPWIGFAFFGENKIVTNSIDENLYDFIRSQDIQTGGSTLSPGEIPNLKYHVKGGIGIFGSMVADTVSTFLLKPETDK